MITLASTGSIVAGNVGSVIQSTSGATVALSLGATSSIQCGNASNIIANAASSVVSNISGGIASGVDGGIKLTGSAADVIAFGTAHARTITYPCSDVAGISVLTSGTLTTSSLGSNPGILGGFVQASIANPSYLLESGSMKPNVIITSSPGYVYYMPLRGLHTGATISSSSLYFIPTSHAALPAQQPAYMIWRVAKDFTSPSAPLLAANYIQNAAANNAAYASILQTLTFVPNQNAVIDTANYIYYAYIYDECSTNAVVGNRFISIGITYSSIVDMRFP